MLATAAGPPGPAAATDDCSSRSHSGSIELAASSSEDLRQVELYEIHTDQGPCIEALRTGHPRSVTDFASSQPDWPQLGLRAVAAGFRAMWAQPMSYRDHTVGVINLYCRTAGPLHPEHQDRAKALARATAISLLHHQALADHDLRIGQLQKALLTRVVIGQAKGILVHRLNLLPDAAFDLLRTHARARRVRLHDLARTLVDNPTGPWPPRDEQSG